MRGSTVRAAGLAMMLAMVPLRGHAAEDSMKGKAVFLAHCAQCHGEKADGQGPLAPRFNPPPANIAASKRSDDYMLQIVTLGGAAIGRSSVMPEWGLELSGEEILDVVTYLRQVVNGNKPRAARATGQPEQGGRS
jgi:mono/diheme cytochrome c family protein